MAAVRALGQVSAVCDGLGFGRGLGEGEGLIAAGLWSNVIVV